MVQIRSAIVGEASGKWGQSGVFVVRRSTQTLRIYQAPANPKTPQQKLVKTYMERAAKVWSSMPKSCRTEWDKHSTEPIVTIGGRLATRINLTGYQLWTRAYFAQSISSPYDAISEFLPIKCPGIPGFSLIPTVGSLRPYLEFTLKLEEEATFNGMIIIPCIHWLKSAGRKPYESSAKMFYHNLNNYFFYSQIYSGQDYQTINISSTTYNFPDLYNKRPYAVFCRLFDKQSGVESYTQTYTSEVTT